MKSFRSSKFLIITILCIFSITITAYTIKAHSVAHYAYEDNTKAVWRSAPPGTFFPWPQPPGMLPVISVISEIDLFIYRYLIKTWLMIMITISFWAITGAYIIKRRPF